MTALSAEIQALVGTVADSTGAERVVLFGSRARGDNTPTSDLDLLVIVPDAACPSAAGHAGYTALGVHGMPVDLVVLRRSDFERRALQPWTLAGAAAREGHVVYDRAA